MTLQASNTLQATPATSPTFRFHVVREDNGGASIQLEKFNSATNLWEVASTAQQTLVQQSNAGWDDAIPWAQGTYAAKYANQFAGDHSWKFSNDPPDREGVRIHLGSVNDPSGPVHGCIGANATFLENAYD